MFHVVRWLWPLLWFLVKVYAAVFTLVWIRATLPRFRYDKLMNFGWKVLITTGLLWVLVTASYVALPLRYSAARSALIIVAGTLAVVLLIGPLFSGAPRGATVATRPGQR